MPQLRPTLPQLVAALPMCIGLIGLARWAFGPNSIGQAVFGFPELFLPGPTLLLVSGAACVSLGHNSTNVELVPNRITRHLLAAASYFVAAIASLMLIEHLAGVRLGVDIVPRGTLPTAQNPYPGRMSINACVGFLGVATALQSLRNRTRTPSHWSTAAIAVVALVALTGIFGRLLNLEHLYRWGASNQLRLPVAIGLGMLAASLWLAREQAMSRRLELDDYEKRIIQRSVAVLTLVAVAAGTGGFAVVQTLYESSQADHLALTAAVDGESIAYSLDMASWLVKTASTRPVVTETLDTLNRKPGDAVARAFLEKVDLSFISAGVDGMTFKTLSGETVTAGRLALTGNEAALELSAKFAGSRLIYSNGFVLATTLPVFDQGRLVGQLRAEQRLVLFEHLVDKLRNSSATTDVLICARKAEVATCLPSRFYPTAFTVPMFAPDGRPTRLLNRAVLGETGVDTNTDLNGNVVVAAYQPLAQTGIGLVVKTNVETFYAAMRERILQLLALMAMLVVLGTFVMRAQVRPLVARLAAERRRSWAILENSNDAFVSLDRDGRVNAWNIEATRTFGWTAAEANGRNLAELIIPPAARAAHESGMARFVTSGAGPVINKRIELTALHKNGSTIPIELSVAATDQGDHYTATAFLRDISARKHAERVLAHSEQRLRLVADSMPALISHIDLCYRYTFTNAHYCNWFSRPASDFAGKTVAEVFGDEIFASVRDRMDEAMAGREVVFELLNAVPGAPKHMLVHYIPERDQAGNVIGIFGLILDRTEQHHATDRIETSERQLRAVTDNLPVLITYVDAEERLKYLNGTFSDWLGVDLADAIGRPIAEVIGPVHYEERRAQIRTALNGERVEFDVVSQTLGGIRNLQTVYIPDVRDDGSVRGLFTLSTDVTALKKSEALLTELARVDTLTGLPNRRQFEERLEQALSRSRRTTKPMALIFLDVDHFKMINDTYGHGTGDLVLKEFAARLQGNIRVTDTAARLAGDEFVVILEGLNLVEEATAVAQKLVEAIRAPVEIGSTTLAVTTSMGVALRQGDADDVSAQELLDRADRALYRAKAAGRNTFNLEPA